MSDLKKVNSQKGNLELKEIEKKVLDTINKFNMITNEDKIVIGVSGGPDSITLLNILNKFKEYLNINIFVAHINHKIRVEADEETKYVHKFCNQIGVDCYIKEVKVEEEAKKLKVGTEEAGRNIRYEFFEEVAKKVGANKIATAHNSNDNAETVLMNIIRGSSVSGLKGIEEVRDGKYIRPLIECERSMIENYCNELKLNPKYDKSNNENIYTRNKIRNLLIPYLQKEFNPNIVEGINRLSTLASEEEQFINKIVKSKFQKLLLNVDTNALILDLKEFNKLDKVIKSRLILYTISKAYGKATGIEKIHIEDIIKLCSNNIGNKYLIPKKGMKIFIKKGKIFFFLNSSFRKE